jgi:hypothetical protein
MCNPVDEHPSALRDTARREFLDQSRAALTGTRPPEGRAWDEVLRQDARRVLAELAHLPPETKRVAWANLTDAERRALRCALQRARAWAAGEDPVWENEGETV